MIGTKPKVVPSEGGCRTGGKMHYTNSQMKLDQLIGYFNERKINLIPPFQRGHVWKLPVRQRLLQNMVTGRPIPAIFLYKEADGSKFTYNILDGKQRLESLLLFIGNGRSDVKVDAVRDYFFSEKERSLINFPINFEGRKGRSKNFLKRLCENFANTQYRQLKSISMTIAR